MNASRIVLDLDSERLDRLRAIKESFHTERKSLPMDVWTNMMDDWQIAFKDNEDTFDELYERYKDFNFCEHKNTIDLGDSEHQAIFCIDEGRRV